MNSLYLFWDVIRSCKLHLHHIVGVEPCTFFIAFSYFIPDQLFLETELRIFFFRNSVNVNNNNNIRNL